MSGDTDDTTHVRAVAVTYEPSIAERILWTSGQLSGAEVKVLMALSACGEYGTGRNCVASLEDLIALSGVSYGTVKRALRRLKDPSHPQGPWVVAVAYLPAKGTRYDICLDRLATRAPQDQQMTLSSLQAGGIKMIHMDQNDPDQNDPDQNDPDQNDPGSPAKHPPTSDPTSIPRARAVRTYVDPSEKEEEHTVCDRARARATLPETGTDPHPDTLDLPLIGALPPPPCAHPYAHAWCGGRVHVPRILHLEFLDRLDTRPGESREAKTKRLEQFYGDTLAAIPTTQVIAVDAFQFWRRAFAAACRAAEPAARTPLRVQRPTPGDINADYVRRRRSGQL
jgi:hypothetical protein